MRAQAAHDAGARAPPVDQRQPQPASGSATQVYDDQPHQR